MSLPAPVDKPTQPVVRMAAKPSTDEASTPAPTIANGGATPGPGNERRADQPVATAPGQSDSPAKARPAPKFVVQAIQPLLRPAPDFEGASESSRLFGGDSSGALHSRFVPGLGGPLMPSFDEIPVGRDSIFDSMRPEPPKGTFGSRQNDLPTTIERLLPSAAGIASRSGAGNGLPERSSANDRQDRAMTDGRSGAWPPGPSAAPAQARMRPGPPVESRPIVQGPTVPPLAPASAPQAVASAPVATPPQPTTMPGPRTVTPEQLPAFVASPMAVISRRAQEHIDYGFNLAERRAVYSAQAEFTQALLLVAQALDAAERTQVHSHAMLTGLQALREADEFVPRQGQVELNTARIVATHKTPVLKRAANPQMSALVAMQEYYTYAQAQLIGAGGREPAAAAALYGMARLQGVMALENDVQKMMGGPRAIALYQAALAIDASNYAAANELGVLLARYGQWADAQMAFAQSVRLGNQPQTWDNLALTYRKLGNQQAADEAVQNYKVSLREKRQGGTGRAAVRLVDPETFVRDSSGTETLDSRPLNTPSPTSANQLPQGTTEQASREAPATRQESDSTLQKFKTKLQAAMSKTAMADDTSVQR